MVSKLLATTVFGSGCKSTGWLGLGVGSLLFRQPFPAHLTSSLAVRHCLIARSCVYEYDMNTPLSDFTAALESVGLSVGAAASGFIAADIC